MAAFNCEATVLLRTAVLALSFLACGSPVAPVATDVSADPNLVRFQRLHEGQRLIVDYHSQGCFISSDAHLMFQPSGGQVHVSGRLTVVGVRQTAPSELDAHELAAVDLLQLDNMLDLYRREEHQTYCLSTGKHTTTLQLTDPDGSVHTEHYDTDGCIEYRVLKDGDITEMRRHENMLFFSDFTWPVLQHMLARARGGAA